jgi:basic membrane lipoprotein Med (substrate-binding protein (PBP1-ABC) superfamily)
MRTPFRIVCAGLLPAAIALALTGCGRPPATSSQPQSGARTTAPGAFRVALICPGSISDNGWNADAYKGLLAVRSALNITAADSPYVENKSTPGAREENMRAFGKEGMNLILCHGAEFQDQALGMEKDFPKTLFVVSSGDKAGSNTTPIIYDLEDGAYLEGMLAAGMSKSGVVGAVGAQKIVPVQSVFEAFAAGARAQRPGIRVIDPVYTDDWEDVGKAKQATIALIQQGADVIIQDLDSAAQGVFGAVQDNKAKGVYALGTNNDQNAAAPDVILASAPIHNDRAFVPIAEAVKAGTFKPNTKSFGMKEGVIGFVLNPRLDSKIPADLKQKLAATQKRITDGSFVVPKKAP